MPAQAHIGDSESRTGSTRSCDTASQSAACRASAWLQVVDVCLGVVRSSNTTFCAKNRCQWTWNLWSCSTTKPRDANASLTSGMEQPEEPSLPSPSQNYYRFLRAPPLWSSRDRICRVFTRRFLGTRMDAEADLHFSCSRLVHQNGRCLTAE